MDKNEQRICWYSSLLVVLMVNTPKLLALREKGIVAQYWHFNLGELLFQIAFNLLFCWLLFYFNLKKIARLAAYRDQEAWFPYFGFNTLLFLACTIAGATIQRIMFVNNQLLRIFLLGSFTRIALSGLLIGILIKILLLLREAKKKDLENEQLKSAFVAAELELLKEQMNPHFLFNSLSSLSGVIRENPEMAQKYVRDLSNVFRYALVRSKANLVTLDEELTMLRSFAQLIYMRLENAFAITIDIDKQYLNYKLPHLSLQPLLENAVKHNAATIQKPLKVEITIQNGQLVVSNNLREIPVPDSSNGLGLVNLNERFKIMMGHEIEIIKTADFFTVKLPLKA